MLRLGWITQSIVTTPLLKEDSQAQMNHLPINNPEILKAGIFIRTRENPLRYIDPDGRGIFDFIRIFKEASTQSFSATA
jgi:hypothetical protein